MTDEERKAWDVVVEDAQDNFHATGNSGDAAILAADAELKRLREAVEWACGDIESHINLGDMDDWRPFKHMAELRRKAKEG